MMTATKNPTRATASWSLACLFLTLFSLVASAGNGGGGGSSGPFTPAASSPGDEVTSLPLTQSVSGLTFVGSLAELRALGASVRGRSALSIQSLANGEFVVTVIGSARIEVDRAALARSNVRVLFRGGDAFRGGLAQLQVLSSAPAVLDSERVPLPLRRLAAAPLLGDVLTLDVAGRRGVQANVVANLSRDRVTLLQRMSF